MKSTSAFVTFRYAVASICYSIGSFFKRPFIVALVGPEGAGKSTLSSALFSNGLLSSSFLYLGENSNKIKFKLKLVELLKNALGSRFFLLLMPFEMWLRFIPFRFKKENCIIMMDRFPLKKKNSSVFLLWYNFFSRAFIPRPNVLILLDGDPKVIWQRKKKSDFPIFMKEFKKCMALLDSNVALQMNLKVDVTRKNPSESLEYIYSQIIPIPEFKLLLQKKAMKFAKWGSMWWLTPETHYKFFLTSEARRELLHSIKAMDYAVTIPDLKGYAPEYKCINEDIIITKRYEKLQPSKHINELLKYFNKNRFRGDRTLANLWDTVSHHILFDYFKNSSIVLDCRNELSKVMINQTFAHRDFHEDNILWDHETHDLKLIDWSDANHHSCYLFDILTLIIFKESKILSKDWYTTVETITLHNSYDISDENPYYEIWMAFKAEINSQVVAAYILDYITVDLNKMSPFERCKKSPKYNQYLNLASNLCTMT